MNKTALSVIALAVGSVLIIGLFNIYKPQTKRLAEKVFHKPQVALQKTNLNDPKKDTPVTNVVKYVSASKTTSPGKILHPADSYPGYTGDFKPQGKFGEKSNIDWYNYDYNHIPGGWNIPYWSGQNDSKHSTDFTFGQNGTVHYVYIIPNWETQGQKNADLSGLK